MSQPLLTALDRLGSPSLLVLGDLILDRYTWGDAERVSPEAPVLVLRADVQEVRLGGAASVAALLHALGARVSLAGVIGCDANGRLLRRRLQDRGIDHSLVFCDLHRPTTTKERFIGRACNRHPHQILRVDQEGRHPLPADLQEQLREEITAQIQDYQALLISDYAKGVCTPHLLSHVLATARECDVPVFVDPAFITDFGRYRGASLLLPNRREAALAAGQPLETPEQALTAAQLLGEQHQVESVVIKLDRDGMVWVSQGQPGQSFLTRPRSVYDVTGAGDMVLAVVGLCRACGLSWEETLALANIAAGWEVEQLGVVPLTRGQLQTEVLRSAKSIAAKLVTLEEMVALANSYRRQGKKLVFTNGCFDLLHVGHVSYLQEAAKLGDILVVAVNSDDGVRRLKGETRPIIPQADRASLLAALNCVDHVLIFDEDTPHQILQQLQPEVLVKGGTYEVEEVVGREVVESYGGNVCVVGKKSGISTTELVSSIRASTLWSEP